jgi:preprotein translocase subunit YajC
MRNPKASHNGAPTGTKLSNAMDEHLFLKGQRVITPGGKGEVVDSTGDKIEVKLDNGVTQTYSSDDIQDDTSAN